MVETTATELHQDLGSGGVAAPRPTREGELSSSDLDLVTARIEALERRSQRQERLVRHLLELVETLHETKR